MSNIAYIRVSSDSQHLDRQEELFKGYKIDKYYMEKVSGKNIKDRPELQKMMDYVREGGHRLCGIHLKIRKIFTGSAKSDQPAQ